MPSSERATFANDNESCLPWLHLVRGGTSRSVGRFIFFPPAGSSASSGWALQSTVPEEWSLWSVQYPARGPRLKDPALGSIREMAVACLPALIAGSTRSLLFGHSFGAYLAYEVAQLLELQGSPAAGLLVSGIPAPGAHLRELSLGELSDTSLIAFLDREGVTSPELLADEELMSLVLPALRSDLALVRSYVDDRGRRLSTAVLALGGSTDRLVSPEQLCTWRGVTRSWLGQALAEGDHFYYLKGSSLLTDVLNRHWPGGLATAAPPQGPLYRWTGP